MQRTEWTHPSAIAVSGGEDPVAVITERARSLVFDAIERGWEGPPFDPVALAELEGIRLEPTVDVVDARLVPVSTDRFRIQFNPDRPRNRIRYSIAHEIAHTLFPDAAERIRYRNRTGRREREHWQLEVLCDLAAAEILMPLGEGAELQETPMVIDALIERQRQYGVSMEAVLLRVLRLTDESCAGFAAARIEGPMGKRPLFRIDYYIGSRAWRHRPRLGGRVLPSAALSRCTAVGYTSKASERWWASGPELRVESVGVPPFPGSIYPRIVGLLLDNGQKALTGRIEYLIGDATAPQPDGSAIIAHIVNDKTPNWGAGFGLALAKKWPVAQEGFRQWARSDKDHLRLGRSHVTVLPDELYAFHMVAQRGYKQHARPLIRYQALDACLARLGKFAEEQNASVHMPFIGTGYAGGNWKIIKELVREHLTTRGVSVVVYSLPNQARPVESGASRDTQLAFRLGA